MKAFDQVQAQHKEMGAKVKNLMNAFDRVQAQHEAMDPKDFIDDGTYKRGIT